MQVKIIVTFDITCWGSPDPSDPTHKHVSWASGFQNGLIINCDESEVLENLKIVYDLGHTAEVIYENKEEKAVE